MVFLSAEVSTCIYMLKIIYSYKQVSVRVKEVMYPSYKREQVCDMVKEVMYPSYKREQVSVRVKEVMYPSYKWEQVCDGKRGHVSII